MDFSDVLKKAKINPERVCVMRHTRKEVKRFSQMLEDWAQNKPDAFNAYQRGQSGRAGVTLQKKEYLASFIGHEPSKAKFVGVYRVGNVRKVSLEEFLKFPENQTLVDIHYPFRKDRPSRRWFDLTVMEGFEDLELKLIINWPGRPNLWCRLAHQNTFRIIEGADLVRDMNTFAVSSPAPRLELLLEDAYPRASPATLKTIIPRHKILSNRFREWLKRDCGIEARQEENQIDVRFEYDGQMVLAELKICQGVGATKSIREALGQVLEYNHYPKRRTSEIWLIVLDTLPGADDLRFIKNLRKNCLCRFWWVGRRITDFPFIRVGPQPSLIRTGGLAASGQTKYAFRVVTGIGVSKASGPTATFI